MNVAHRISFAFEIGPIRPPSEGQDRSLLIRATRNCPWNRCHFCNTYKGRRFEYRSVAEVKGDIDEARAIYDELNAASWRIGRGGRVTSEVIRAMVGGNPRLYDREGVEPQALRARIESAVNVANWASTGARTVFLQDANTLIMRTHELVELLCYLKQTFPSVERVTCYGRAKTAATKSLPELVELHEAGLSRLHVGLESGDDQVLREMEKGVTAEEHMLGGRKMVEAGISLSEYVMPGLGGRRWSQQHALESARVLNQIDPDFIRLRSLVVLKGSPLYDRAEAGDFEPLSEDEVVDEIGLFIENLDCNSYLASDQMSNLLWEIEGQLPQDKQQMLATIAQYRAMALVERLEFRLRRRLSSYLSVYGGMDEDLRERVEQALQSITSESPDAEAKVETAISAIKQGFI